MKLLLLFLGFIFVAIALVLLKPIAKSLFDKRVIPSKRVKW